MIAILPHIPGLAMDMRLAEPDRHAWHLSVACAQLRTCHMLPLEADIADVMRCVGEHIVRKVAAAVRN